VLKLRVRYSNGADSGWAMLTVIASLLIMTIFVTAALALASGRQKTAKRDQDFTAAGQAADSGVDDYLARLQANGNYFTLGNSDATNAAMSGWAPVPGTASNGSFHYRVDTSQEYTSGVLTLTSTGRANGVDRTVTAKLAKTSFLDYMYFTDYETQSPVTYSQSDISQAGGIGALTTTCKTYLYAGRRVPDADHDYCGPIYFTSGDVLKGPVYSNDAMQFSGSPSFQSTFGTSWQDPSAKYWICESGATCNPTFAQSPINESLPFPSTNNQLAQFADPSLGGGGCLFVGPTSITLNANATMSIVSPETPSAKSTGACGTHSWASAVTVDVPSGQVIYDESQSPATCSSYPAGLAGFPASGDTNTTGQPTGLATGGSSSCANGDVFVQGWLKGQLTIASTNNIYITDSIRYVGSNGSPSAGNLDSGIPTSSSSTPPAADTNGTDVLGLSANNFVEVYHPLTSCSGANRTRSGTCPTSARDGGSARTNLEIDAAIVASNGSFLVEDWGSGPQLGVLSVNGGMIQRFRGPVGCTGCWSGNAQTGYIKDYNYDKRLVTLAPPHLADLAASAWNPVEFGEGSPN
jgi:Tfp pilus assembly protein PilX